MAVSRKGKRGTHTQRRRATRAGRVRLNAGYKSLTKHLDDRPIKAKITREEFMINAAVVAVGKRAGFGFVQADDLVSDIILKLLDAGGIAWSDDEIKDFCRKKSQWMVERWRSRREISECEFINSSPFGSEDVSSVLEDMSGWVPPMQELVVDCNTWRGRMRELPTEQRQALEILCDGGNPIDIANEMDVTPWKAIALIREGRDWIHRVDGDSEPW